MAGETKQQAQAISEILAWLEQQVRQAREEQTRANAAFEQLRRQVHGIAEEMDGVERGLREIDPKFIPFKGLPEKIRSLDEGSEHMRQAIASNRADVENALRIIRAEGEYDRVERSEAIKRIESAASQLGLVLADMAQVQKQVGQLGQGVQTLQERQREVEARVEQFGLRLDRTIEVNRDLEGRIRQVLLGEQEERFEVVFERLQVVGEMVKRNEDLISSATAEQTLREEVIDEISVWRDQHSRIDGRLNALEELTEKVLGQIDKVRGDVTLVEGRHAGLGERVGGIRRDIAEVLDEVRAEFAKYNQLVEKQRRKQIQVLEQELREMKFHAFRPPDEP